MAATVDDLALQVATLTSQLSALLSAVNVQKSYIDMASQIAVSGITGSSGSSVPAVGKSPIGSPAGLFSYAWLDPTTDPAISATPAISKSPIGGANGMFSYAWLDPATNVVLAANCAGTANAITATFAPAVTSLVNGLTVEVRAASANTTATPTFQANASAAKTIVKGSGVALVAGDISGAGHWLTLTFDSTLDKWVLGNPAMGLGVAMKGINTDIVALNAIASINGGPVSGFLNRVRNGDMRVAQRGVSGISGFCIDGFFLNYAGGAATWNQIVGAAVIPGVGKSAWLQVNGSAGCTDFNIIQNIEAQDCWDLAGNTVSFSYWTYQNTGAAITVTTELKYATAENNFAGSTSIGTATGTVVPHATWTKVYGSFAVPPAAITGLQLLMYKQTQPLVAGQIACLTDVQLTFGVTQMLFERLPFTTQENRCKRYVRKGIARIQQYSSSTGSDKAVVWFGSDMFKAPNVTLSNTAASPNYTGQNVSESSVGQFSYNANSSANASSAFSNSDFIAIAELT
jgi:hypothetical protein